MTYHRLMGSPSRSTIAVARQAGSRMAGRLTPFIFNEWYIAGFAHEFTGSLRQRTILGRPLVFFRTAAGEPVALEDRCLHRSFPLSAGRLDGDQIECAYHGFRFDAAGTLVKVPSQSRCPAGLGVRRYPLAQQGALVWIWMGDAALADAARVPVFDWALSPDWQTSSGYLHMPANYVGLHENLLDLTHIEFLHAATLGMNAVNYSASPYELILEEGHYALTRRIEPTPLPPVFAETTGLGYIPTAGRLSRSEFMSPAYALVTASYYDGSLPADTRPEYAVTTAHLVTPETQSSTHYFIHHGWNFGRGDERVERIQHEQLFAAFREDVAGLTLVQRSLEAHDQEPEFFEISVATDAAAVAMRRHLKQRSEAEAAARADRACL